jgi:pimeloyl-ACP methyl ester carboxylesterase
MSATIRFDEAGRGPAIVLIHGFPLCRKMWQPQMEELAAAGYRVIAPDLPGYGETPLVGTASMDLYADALIGLIDHLGLEKVIFGGMSMGGYVLCNLLQRYPQRVAAALFLMTRAAADDDAGRAHRTTLAAEASKGNLGPIVNAFESILFAPGGASKRPELVERVRGWMLATPPEGVAGGLLAMRDRPDMISHLRNFNVPTLVVGAELDVAIALGHSKLLAEQIPNACFEVIPEAGHLANLEQPELFSAVLRDYLASLHLFEDA